MARSDGSFCVSMMRIGLAGVDALATKSNALLDQHAVEWARLQPSDAIEPIVLQEISADFFNGNAALL